MNKQEKYLPQIIAVSREASRLLSAPLDLFTELLDSPSPAIRGACVCLLRDFARGKLPTMPQEMQMQIARKLQQRLTVESDPFLRELIVREFALLLDPDRESAFVNLEPSEN